MADLPTTLRSQAFIASGKHDQFLYTTAADEIWKLRREAREAAKRIQQLESKLYDAYGLGIDDGIDMETRPHGLGGKTRREVLAALLKENDK